MSSLDKALILLHEKSMDDGIIDTPIGAEHLIMEITRKCNLYAVAIKV